MYLMCKTSCLYQTCYKSNDTDNMNQQIRYKMKDTQFVITMASKSPTVMASKSPASERSLALQTILAEIDGTVRYLMLYTLPKNQYKVYFIYNAELKSDVTRILTRLTSSQID